MAQKVQVQSNGKAPSGLSVGDEVVTAGGTYRITGVNADGTYQSGLVGAVTGNEYSSTNNDIGTALNQAMASGASGDTVASILADRTNKALTTGNSQYAYDDIYSAANQYIKNYNQQQADDAYNRGLNEANKKNSTKYSGTIDSLVDSILNGTYESWKQGGEYAALEGQYSANGKKAMQNTLAEVSNRTGGLASSYAITASNQAYNDYMSALESAALDMYRADRNDKFNQVSMLQGLDSDAYNKYRDTIADQRYEDETAYNREQDSYSRQLQNAETLAAYGDFSGYKALGYSDSQIATMKAAYDTAMGKSSSGSGRGTSSNYSGVATATDLNRDYQRWISSGLDEEDFWNNQRYKNYVNTATGKTYTESDAKKVVSGTSEVIAIQNLIDAGASYETVNQAIAEAENLSADQKLALTKYKARYGR